jgi:hypothetical protein
MIRAMRRHGPVLAVGLVLTLWPRPVVGQGPPPPPRDVQVPPGAAASIRPALPPLTPDAQRLVDQWKQDLGSVIEQLRFLQLTYRDSGHAEAAAAIAAQIRTLQQPAGGRGPAGGVTPELVNEGLPTRDLPIAMSLFRDHPGETLSFAVRGRDDQPVWGTKTYTDDSALETAAVHAGLMRAGQSAIVKVTPLPGQDRYDASAQNGVQSSPFGEHRGSYRFVSASVVTPARTASMQSYRDLVGHSITIPVVGSATGQVWGSDVYTDDSSVAAAAVHAGVLAPGEFGFVKVTLAPGQERYDGTTRNGVNSSLFETWQGSFRVERASEPYTVQLPGGEDASRVVNMEALRNRPGTSFLVQVVGAVGGTVWGTDVYTDDSSIAAAAVHAGALKAGELGFVRVTTDRPRESYAASERNGIKSQPYAKWDGSFRVERAPK